jgi:polysaccharide biosynthesis protein PslH
MQVSSTQEAADAEKLRQQGYNVVVVEESKRAAALRSGFAIFQGYPLQVAYARSERLLHKAQQLCLQQHFDVIHVEHLRGIASVEQLCGDYPVVWDAVDCISLLWEQAEKEGHNALVRALAAFEHRRTRSYEGRIVPLPARVVTIAERDRQALLALCPPYIDMDKRIDVVSSGVDLSYFAPEQPDRLPHNIVFSGKMSYHANVAAALFLARQVMPLIWRERPEVTLTLVGSKPPAVIQHLTQDHRIEVTGYVDDIRPYIRRAQVMVSPMVYSVGLQNKVLEAMALGTPAIVSAQSLAALQTLPGRDLLSAHSAEDFAASALRVLDDAELQTTLSQYGRMYVEQHHNWRHVTDQLIDIYQQTASKPAQHVIQPAPLKEESTEVLCDVREPSSSTL